VAWYAGLVLVTTSTFHHFATALRMDALLTCGILLAFLGYLNAIRRWGPYAFFGGIAIGIMTKGPPALAPLVLVPLHAGLARPALGRGRYWLCAASILLIPIAWYAYLVDMHGTRVFTELIADAVRGAPASAGAQVRSAWSEYVLRPLRQYWPWLPFMVGGLVIAARRIAAAPQPEARAHACVLLMWVVGVVAAASFKPDHDIRYLFAALPPLAILAAVALARVTADRVPRWIAAVVVLATLAAGVFVAAPALLMEDTRPQIAAMRARLDRDLAPGASVLVVGSNPNNEPGPRRQHPEVDWVHYYFGRPARVVVPAQAAALDLAAEPVVLVARYGQRARVLADLGLEAEITGTEVALAVARR
jgi:4-amino-4-deoxy-L-arabinose transferase-like glycosyltransferase